MNNNQYNPMYNPYSMPNTNVSQSGTMKQTLDTSISPNQGNTTQNTQQTADKNTNNYSTSYGSMNENSDMTSSDGMNFIPFMNENQNMQNLQQTMGQNGNYPQMKDINAIFKKLLNGDITKIPFIPNPYYMLNMKQNSEANTQSGRQHNQMYSYHNMPYPYPHPYPYPQQNYNHNYNMYPGHYYDHDYDYYPNNGINPFTWWLLSSMFREY